MVSPLELLNQRARGVTYMPQVRIPPPARRGPPITPRLAPQQQFGQGGGDWVTPNFEAIQSYAAPKPAETGGGGLSGLGWLVGKPLQAGLKALSVLDYPRATVNALISEVVPEIIERMPDADKYPALDTDFSWADIGRNIREHKGFGETLVEPIMGPEGSDWNIWVRRGLGLAGDIATDPFSYLTAGTKAAIGAPARAEYANKLLDAQQAVARKVASEQALLEKLPAMVERPTFGYGAVAKEMMGANLARAEREMPELLARQTALGNVADVERIGQRGVGIASPEQLAEMGLAQHALRWGGVELPGTERISRGISRAAAPAKARITASVPVTKLRALRTPTGEAGQDLGRAMERILTGKGTMSMERALRTVKLDQWVREGGSTFRGFAAQALRQLDQQLSGMDGAERAALMQAAETGEDNIVALMGPRMIAAAKEAGIRLPELEGQRYVPHVLSREAFNFLDKMRQGKNPLVDEFRRKMGIRSEDLLEEGGFLQKRVFRPDPKTGEPFKMKIGGQEIVIRRGDLAELEEQLGGVLRSAGFEGKLYETDPVEAYKRYIIATERDVGKRFAAKRGAARGYEGLYREPREMGPEGYQPVIEQPILPRGPGEPARAMAVVNPQAAPEGGDLFEYVANEAATEARNRRLARKAPRGKQAQGLTQREILAEYQTLGQAERENIAARIDETAAAAWNPHREEMAALRKEERAARDQVEEAARIGQQQRLQIDQIDEAIAEADRQIASLQSRIGGITSQARRKIEVQSQMMLDNLTRELDAAQAERQRLMNYFDDAVARSRSQLPGAERRAARRAEIAPIRQERKLRRAAAAAKAKAKSDRQWAENYLRGEALDPKTGRSRWISADRYKSAQARLDDPKRQAQYNALFEERNAIAARRTQLADEAADHEREALEATSRANRAKGTYEEEQQLEYALQQKQLANTKKRQAAELIDAHNKVQADINNHVLARDLQTMRAWNKQQQAIDRFTRDIGLGRRVDVAGSRRAARQAELDVQDFLRQKMHEAAYQAQPPPASLSEYYQRELPKATETLESPQAAELAANSKRLREVEQQLKQNPEPTMKDVSLPEATWTGKGGSYQLKLGEGEFDRYSIEHIVIPASEAPAGYGRVDYWAVAFPGERTPDVAGASLREAKAQVAAHREMQALGEAKRAWRAQTEALNTERQRLRQWLDDNAIRGEKVAQAQRTATGAAAHTERQIEIESARKVLDEHQATLSKLNARDDLEQALTEPEPRWDPAAEKRAEFDARHTEWAKRQRSARTQLNKVRRQLRDLGDQVPKAQSARRRLNELEAAAAREFENIPKAQRPPFFADIEARNAANIARAGDQAAQLREVARKWEPPAAEAVAAERMAAAKLGRAAIGGAEETAEGAPTTIEGLTMQVARGTEEVEGAMPEIARARQRIEELHAGQKLNEADREAVEEVQAAWFAPYSQGLENQRLARARYKEIETRAAGLKQPRSAVATTEGKRGGRPFGSQLNLVGGAKPKPAAPGGLTALVGSPAYEAQPMYRTIEDINKLIAANPTGDDALMNRIEAEVGNHLTHLDRLTREYDLPAHQLNRIIKQANNGTLAPVLKRQLREGFEYMWEGGDIIIDKELKAIYFNVAKQLDSKLFGRTFTMLTDFFKTYATLTPGFHVRNAISAIFMNSSEGVKMATQRDGVRLWRQFVEADDPVVWMRGQDKAVQDAIRATFASGAGGQFLERGVSELRAGGVRMSERVFANRLTRMSQRFGVDWVEGPLRLALALDSTRNGMTITDAMNRITRIHFDYGQVSRFDEKAKRVIPFWTFMSRNVPLQFTQMWTKPRTYLHYQSFVRNMTMGAEQDPFIPEYIRQGGGFDTGIRTPGWLANSPLASLPIVGGFVPPEGMPVVLQPDLPHVRLQEDVRRTAAALGGDNPGQILSDVNPFFTAPFEYAMGKDFFTGKEYGPEDWSRASGIGTPLAMLASPFGGGKRGPGGEWYMQDKMMNLLRSLIPPIDRTARMTPGLLEAEPEGQDRMLESYIRFLGGPVRTISEDQKRAEAARRYYDALDLLRERQATGG